MIPAGLGPDGWIPASGGEPYVQDPWHSWANVEIDVFAGVGLRVGLCPDELVDLLAGLVGLDLLGDDPGGSTDEYWNVDLIAKWAAFLKRRVPTSRSEP